jgi:hypothetical protein
MASPLRSALIAAERGYASADDLWIPWDVRPRNCLVYRDSVLEKPQSLVGNRSSGDPAGVPISRGNSGRASFHPAPFSSFFSHSEVKDVAREATVRLENQSWLILILARISRAQDVYLKSRSFPQNRCRRQRREQRIPGLDASLASNETVADRCTIPVTSPSSHDT